MGFGIFEGFMSTMANYDQHYHILAYGHHRPMVSAVYRPILYNDLLYVSPCPIGHLAQLLSFTLCPIMLMHHGIGLGRLDRPPFHRR